MIHLRGLHIAYSLRGHGSSKQPSSAVLYPPLQHLTILILLRAEDRCSGAVQVVREDTMASNVAQTTQVVTTAAQLKPEDFHSSSIADAEGHEVTRLESKAPKTAWPASVYNTAAPDTPQAHHDHVSHAEVDTAAMPDSSEDVCSASCQHSEGIEEMAFNVIGTVSPAVDHAAHDHDRHSQQVCTQMYFVFPLCNVPSYIPSSCCSTVKSCICIA